MAFLNPLAHRRPVLIVGALTLTAALAPAAVSATATATPLKPKPTVTSVTAQLDTLAMKTEALTERYNAATIHLTDVGNAAKVAERRVAVATASRDTAHAEFVQVIQAQYLNGPMTTVGSLLTSKSPRVYMDRLMIEAMVNDHEVTVVSELVRAKTRADRAGRTELKLLAKAKAERAVLSAKRATIRSRTTDLKALLATLTAAQRQRYVNRGTVSPNQAKAVFAQATAVHKHARAVHRHIGAAYTVHAGNAAAQKAVDFALAQVGKPYVFAAAGPNSYDCSGLTMAAWRKGGVHLPHQSSAQYHYGTHVGYHDLQPGDLVFLYRNLGHVEIYIGNGLAVSAPQPGENVKIIRVADSKSDFHGATRLT